MKTNNLFFVLFCIVFSVYGMNDQRQLDALKSAVENNQPDQVNELLRKNTGIGGYAKGRLLGSAVKLADPTIAKLLVYHGADLSTRTGSHRERIFECCDNNIQMVRAVITAPRKLPTPGAKWLELQERLFAFCCCLQRKYKQVPKDIRLLLCQKVVEAAEYQEKKAAEEGLRAFLICAKRLEMARNNIWIPRYIRKKIVKEYLLPDERFISFGTLCSLARYNLVDRGPVLDRLVTKHVFRISKVLRQNNRYGTIAWIGINCETMPLLNHDPQEIRSRFGDEIRQGYRKLLI